MLVGGLSACYSLLLYILHCTALYMIFNCEAWFGLWLILCNCTVASTCILRELLNEDVVERLIRHEAPPYQVSRPHPSSIIPRSIRA